MGLPIGGGAGSIRSDVWRPQAGDGQGPQAVAETGGDLPVVDDGAADESVAGRGGKPSEAAKVGGSGRRRCLDFDAADAVSASLDDEINLDTLPVAEMEQSVPTGWALAWPRSSLYTNVSVSWPSSLRSW